MVAEKYIKELNGSNKYIFFTIDVGSFDCDSGLISSLGGDILSVARSLDDWVVRIRP